MKGRNFGWVSSTDGTKKEDVIVSMPKDLIFMTLGGIAAIGVCIWTMVKEAFYRGGHESIAAEEEALSKIGAIEK